MIMMKICYHPRHRLSVQRLTRCVFAFSLAAHWKSCSLMSDIQPSVSSCFGSYQTTRHIGSGCWWWPIHIPDKWSCIERQYGWKRQKVSLLLVFFDLLCILTANWLPCNRNIVLGDFESWGLSRQRTAPEPFDHNERLLGQLFYIVWYPIWHHQCK